MELAIEAASAYSRCYLDANLGAVVGVVWLLRGESDAVASAGWVVHVQAWESFVPLDGVLMDGGALWVINPCT